MKVYFEKIVIVIATITVVIGYYFSFLSMEITMWSGIVANLYLIIKSRKFKPLAFLFFFWLTFIINLIPYYKNGYDISGGYYQLDIPQYYDRATFVHVFLLLCTALLMPTIKKRIYLKDRIPVKLDNFSFWFTSLFMLFILLYGAKGQSVFEAQGYGQTAVEGLGGLAVYEYFVILIPAAYMFSGNSKYHRLVLYLLITLFSLRTLSFGGRNLLIQIAMILFVFLDNPRLKYRYLIILAFIPVYFFFVFGALRQNPYLIFNASVEEILLLPFNNKSEGSILEALLTQNDVFYSSVRFYAFIEEEIITTEERVQVLLFNSLAVIVPFKFLPDIANISTYRRDIYNCGGGALISSYYYLFLGLPGVVFISAYLTFVIKKIEFTINKYWLVYGIAFLSTFVRWFAYNPIVIFKLCVFGVLYIVVLEIVKSTIRLSAASYEKQKLLFSKFQKKK